MSLELVGVSGVSLCLTGLKLLGRLLCCCPLGTDLACFQRVGSHALSLRAKGDVGF